MKHIVFIVGNYKNGGVAMRSTNLANAFAEKGYNVTILVRKEISDNVFFSINKNVEIVSLNDFIKTHTNHPKIEALRKKRLLKIYFIKKIRSLIHSIQFLDQKLEYEINKLRRSEEMFVYTSFYPDSIYVAMGLVGYAATYFSLNNKHRKIIYAERNASELEFPSDPIKKSRMVDIVSKANGVVLQTQSELEFYDGKLKNAVVINNPVKANLPEPYIGERRKVIVTFCRIAKQKNLPLLINAFLEFHKTHPDYSLEIYGNTVEKIEDELKISYLEMISSLNAEEYIRILPPRADIHSVARDCAMFVSSSDFEGLSNSMLEALAIGLPCVCTDCLGGGAREMITDGENGLLVPMKDVNALAQAMCRIAENNELSEKLSENAAKVRETHNVEAIADKWLKAIEKFI